MMLMITVTESALWLICSVGALVILFIIIIIIRVKMSANEYVLDCSVKLLKLGSSLKPVAL